MPTNPLGDCFNRSQNLTHSKLTRKWTKLACAPSTSNLIGPLLMNTDHRPSVDQEEEQRGKRQCMNICEDDNRENFQVVVGSQHHRMQ